MPDLAVVVPTRGRPENIRRLIGAWDFTNAWDVADLILAVDADDPQLPRYVELFERSQDIVTGDHRFSLATQDVWVPMVEKLNRVAVAAAESRRYFAVAFAGDDHVPETIGWAQRYLTVLREMGTGMVYGDDGYQSSKLSTEWAVTSDAIRALGRMVPAPVQHLYCDNAMMDLYGGAGALRHLPEVRIEHRHPVAGKAKTDDQYQVVNSQHQYAADGRKYQMWKTTGGPNRLQSQINLIRGLRFGKADEPPVQPIQPTPPPPARRPRGEARRSGPTRDRQVMSRFPFSAEFKNVRGATPDEIGVALADFARQVPADQEIVELGVFNGRTALIMAWGAAQGHGAHVTAIDPWDLTGNVYDPPFTDVESKNWAEYWVRTLGYSDRINLVQAFSHNVAIVWGAEENRNLKGPIGLLFVDGDHTREGARRDIELWATHLAPGAVIAVDDYGHPDWPGVGEAVDELVAEGFLAPIEIYHDRLAVTRLDTGRAVTRKPSAVTSEGVSPSPELTDEQRAELEAEWERVDPEGVAALRESAAEIDSRMSVQAGELEGTAAGTPVTELNTVQLRALAKVRRISLGARKDKRDAMLQALADGR